MMNCEKIIQSKVFDLVTYIIETTPKEELFNQLLICGMVKLEYDNIEKLSYKRYCELAWLLEKYIDIRGDDKILSSDKYHLYHSIVNENFPKCTLSDKTNIEFWR